MRSVVTGDLFDQLLDALDGAAPAAIADDVRADTGWFRTRWHDVAEAYGYDVRSIYGRATPEDLAAFNRSHPAVAKHAARVAAYEAQFCAG